MSIFKCISGASGVASGAVQYYHQQCEQRVREAGPRIRDQLCRAGVVWVSVDYDGEGDTGQLEEVILKDAEGAVFAELKELEAEIKNLFYDLLETRHGGWENNEGAFGSFVWDVVHDTLEHEHSSRFMDVFTTTHQGFGDEAEQTGEPS